jgi:serine/threonine-protein kinase
MVDDPTRPYAPSPAELPTQTAAEGGVEPAVTPTMRASDADIKPVIASMILPEAGYKLGHTIGRGGMGEVLAAHDTRIGRDVAIKRMRNHTPNKEAVSRFLREARIQARLDHPAIVPVHELGVDDNNRPFFTMKRCAGKTLARMIADGEPFHRLLRAFVDVCLAIDFAHARGVVHRDLKPANIICGDYGEVYVLDWGVARVLADGPDAEASASIQPESETPDPEDSTKSGALLGTPGYIPPEQIEGIPPAPPADVYSLGCILFEILACEPLHPRGEPAIGRTLSTPQARPAVRRPDRAIPPELDEACFDALAERPGDRPTARELADRVQDYLDGDRDLERRRTLAAQQLVFAKTAIESNDADARITALRAAGRAIALDPEALGAAEFVSAILLEPPKEMPAELEQSLDEHEKRINRDRSKKAIFAYSTIFALLPLTLFLEVKNWPVVGAFFGCVALGIAASVQNYRVGRPSVAVTLTVNLALALLFTRVAGPFVLTPLVIAGLLVGLTQISWLNERIWVVVGWTAVAVMLPIIFEWVDLLPNTWAISDGSMIIQSDVIRTHGLFEELCLVFTSLLFTIVIGIFALTVNRRRRRSQRALFIHAWHLRQLVPATRSWATQPR